MSIDTLTLSEHQLAQRLFEQVLLIREFEQRAGKAYAEGEIPGFIHLSIGQEAVAAGVCAALDQRDRITSTHRGHGHVLARGCDPGRVLAEIYARETGLCHGRGGTMHLYDSERGVLGTNGIVAAGGPLACGAALAARMAGQGAVVVCFMGDGATDQGATHEAMNLAAVWSLPLVFVLENNGFSEGMPLAAHTSIAALVDRAAAYSIPAERVDGQNALAVHAAAQTAVDRARAGDGPSFIEAMTCRFRGHFEGDAMKYGRDEQDSVGGARDPVRVLRETLQQEFGESPEALDAYASGAAAVIEKAIQVARAAARPDGASVHDYVFATTPSSSGS